ncbi:inositol monophosphatase family protein [Lacibacterium aquatile]|uniref:Inositol monophosphatase family protein n=1 Tax=Lacibacterium aquatile TaxID=1168082 RepID=A0ABW5DTR5_9PROT
MSTHQHFAEFALSLLDRTRPVVAQYFRKDIPIEIKSDASPVTLCDKAVEAEIRAALAETFPDHGIFGEEHGKTALDAKYVWVIDPIDGTRAFITGVPLFGTLVALLEDGKPILGMIDTPALGETWLGVDGTTSFNGQPCKTRQRALKDAAIFTTTPDLYKGENQRRWLAVQNAVQTVRYGTDCYAAGLVASGLADGMIEVGIQPYDVLALVNVIEGAGGKVTDWSGRPLGIDGDGTLLAAGTPELHAELLALLA